LTESIRLATFVCIPLDTLLLWHCSLHCPCRLFFSVRHSNTFLHCMRLLLIQNTTNRSPPVPESTDRRGIPSPQPQQPWTSSSNWQTRSCSTLYTPLSFPPLHRPLPAMRPSQASERSPPLSPCHMRLGSTSPRRSSSPSSPPSMPT
jgi:hypothetical protein